MALRTKSDGEDGGLMLVVGVCSRLLIFGGSNYYGGGLFVMVVMGHFYLVMLMGLNCFGFELVQWCWVAVWAGFSFDGCFQLQLLHGWV